MRRFVQTGMAGATMLLLAGCYHATIDTGRRPSTEVVEQAFAASWVYGLVPPKTVETASQCRNGVARVETQLSFVNQLVGILTLGIYTPMHIRVTCAAAGEDTDAPATDVSATATEREQREALTEAAALSLERDGPVYVRFSSR